MSNNSILLQKKFPALTVADIERLYSVYHSIKYRCGKHKNYLKVKCEWPTFKHYLTFICNEIEAGRDFRDWKRFATCRRFDNFHYRDDNCYIASHEHNIKEGTIKGFKVYDSHTKLTHSFTDVSIIELFEHNKDRFKISLKTFYKYIKLGKMIQVFNEQDEYQGFIKVSYL